MYIDFVNAPTIVNLKFFARIHFEIIGQTYGLGIILVLELCNLFLARSIV
ncbi:MAG: Uncharacterised protein [Owenweeksia sp. TMED14]|nr:MAG: Uncharacterised protein [Owenweeksia sp. TMED14]